MRVLACGTREFTDMELIRYVLKRLPSNSVVIEGEARGADVLSKKVAGELGFEVLMFTADWDKHGKSAGMLRNQRMLEQGKPEVVYAFYMSKEDQDKSKGTKDMVRRAREAGVRTVEFISSDFFETSRGLQQPKNGANMQTEVVNIKRSGCDVYIGRPSKWGNPFASGRDGTREEVIKKYREYIVARPDLMNSLNELRGKRLGCYCKPLACHGDVLIELLQQIDERKEELSHTHFAVSLSMEHLSNPSS